MARRGPSVATAQHTDLENYIITITGPESKIGKGGVRAWMPEQLQFGVASSYESKMAGLMDSLISSLPIVGGIASKIAGGVTALTGYALTTKKLSLQTWNSTSPMTMNLQLVFMAIDDPEVDVKKPIVALMNCVVPSEENVLLRSPGPTFADPDFCYQIRYGKIAYFEKCIITNVSMNADSLVTKGGHLIGAMADVQIETATVVTSEDLFKIFLL